uniref:RRM domain-containing protein n=1 Tax=Globodera rostochiensis TaxID=31243 RepID=A0A914HBY8_GLORO
MSSEVPSSAISLSAEFAGLPSACFRGDPSMVLPRSSGSSLMQLMLSHQQPNCQQPQSRKLFIGGLGQVNDDALRQYYSQWGQVVDCIVIRDPATRSSRGFGFVTYATPEMADVAIAHRPHKINGKAVDAKRAVPRERMNLILDNDPIPFFMNIEPDLGCRLHLSGLNWEWHTLDTLRSYFAKFGAVEQLEMVAYPRGCGSLVFDSLNAAQHCLAAGGKHSVNGHPIEVRMMTSDFSPLFSPARPNSSDSALSACSVQRSSAPLNLL